MLLPLQRFLRVVVGLGILGLGIITLADPLRHARKADASPVAAVRPQPLRIGVGSRTWVGINRTAATAAITAWTLSLARQSGIWIQPSTLAFDSTESLQAAIRAGELEAYSMLTEDFLRLDPDLRPDSVFVSTRKGLPTEQFVLLVHLESGLADLAALDRRRMIIQSNHRAYPALRWLRNLMGESTEEALGLRFSNLAKAEAPSRALLQVFFRQFDACLVTAQVFETAAELNPQLRQQLIPIARSEPVVPVLFAFHPSFTSTTRTELEEAMLGLHRTPAGRQVLAAFQGDGMARLPVTFLDAIPHWLALSEPAPTTAGTH